MTATILLAVIFCSALLAPLLPLCDPQKQSLRDRLMPPFHRGNDGTLFVLGTDQLGRDMLSRIVYGGRISLFVSFMATGIGMILGVSLGIMAGFSRGLIDTCTMRLIDAQLSFPFILIAVTVIAVLGPSVTNLILVLIISAWAPFARIVRGELLLVRELDYITAVRVLGATNSRIIACHILPQVVNSIIVVASLEIGRMILIESSLSFLGLGVPESVPTWGGMLSDSRRYLVSAWWFSTFPGIPIVLSVISVNLFGDFLRDYFDPKLRNLGT